MLTIHASIVTRCQHWWKVKGGPKVNKFELVSGDGKGVGLGGSLIPYREWVGEVPCLVVTWGPLPLENRQILRQTDTTENITFSQLRWRAVIKLYKNL